VRPPEAGASARGRRVGIAGPYPDDVLLSPEFLVIVLLVALLALAPVRRLHLLGWPASWLRTYWIGLLLGGLILGEVPSTAKLLVPALLVAGILPYVAGGLLGRAARRRGR
jgi:hypothetical protein